MRRGVVPGLLAGIGLVLSAGAARAETWAWTCEGVWNTPEFVRAGGSVLTGPLVKADVTVEVRPQGKVEIRSSFAHADLSVEDPDSPENVSLAANRDGQFVTAYGTTKAVLFDRKSVDACIAAVRRDHPEAFRDAMSIATNGHLPECYARAPMTPEPVPAEVAVDISQENRGGAVRRYLHLTLWHTGDELDDDTQFLRQTNFNGECRPR